MNRLGFLLAVALLGVPLTAFAQLCRGGVDFEGVSFQGQAQLELDERSSSYGLAGGFGGRAFFGTASLAARTYEWREGETIVFGVGGGHLFRNSFTTPALHCIEIRGDFGTGPDSPGAERADESSSSLTFELTTGLPLGGGAVQFTPFVGLAFRYSSVVTQTDETSNALNDSHTLVTVGLGMAAGDQYALQPYLQLPMGRAEGSDPVFGMRLSMNFGRR